MVCPHSKQGTGGRVEKKYGRSRRPTQVITLKNKKLQKLFFLISTYAKCREMLGPVWAGK